MMKIGSDDWKRWRSKTANLNRDHVLRRGDRVIDDQQNVGIVVRIEIPYEPTIEDHGTIWVWLENEDGGYGAYNCEHWAWINWKDNLRFLPDEVLGD